ncbi:MAG: hypothetical protein OEM07_03935 [Gammaproteobacteria bacterium]|nr:hypothetical protein [Gammaproteobacteria bacterium]
MRIKSPEAGLYHHLIKFAAVILLALAFSSSAQANNDSIIELSKSSRSETLGNIYTFGLYSSLSTDAQSSIYGGINLIFLENNAINKSDSTLKIFAGQSLGKKVSAFYEIGTDLYGFITLFDNDQETHTCKEDQRCAFDLFFKIGMKIQLGSHLMLGIFHENISFGDFHENLSGEHRYVGSSLGIKF